MNKFLIGISLAALGGAGLAIAQDRGPGFDPMGDKIVTRAEAQTMAAEEFAKLDANHDGKLDQSDRAEHREERKEARFAMLDTNKDGSISREEFAAAHPDGHRGAPGRNGPGGMGRGDHDGMAMMMVHMADANKDGVVTKEEFTASHLAMFDKADTNKDGKVTPEERQAAHARMREHMKGMKGKHRGDRGMPPPPPPAG